MLKRTSDLLCVHPSPKYQPDHQEEAQPAQAQSGGEAEGKQALRGQRELPGPPGEAQRVEEFEGQANAKQAGAQESDKL